MIIQELLQVAELDFISRAPDNTEVEHLTHKQIMKCLRDKVSAELFMEQNKWARPGFSGVKAKSSDKKTRRGTKSKSSKEEKTTPKEKEVTEKVPAEAAVASSVFMEQLDQLQGTKNARLLMGDEVADEVSISGLQEVLETRKNNGANTLVMDGIITQRLIELVPKAGIKIIVAEKKGPLPRDPVGITMFTREDLT
jgi:DNA primase